MSSRADAALPGAPAGRAGSSGERHRNRLPFGAVLGICLGVLTASIVLSFFIGRFQVAPGDALRIMAARVAPVVRTWDPLEEQVVWDIRWPRILMAVLVGSALSCSGATYQGVFRNPLVSPDILGVTAAASFGAAVGIVLADPYSPAVQVLAFCCGAAGVGTAYLLARVRGTVPNVMLILAGVVVSSVFNAGVSVMKYLADPQDELPAITFWLMGSLAGMRWANLAFAAPIILLGGAVLWVFSWRLNLLTMGDEEARSLGVDTARLKTIAVLCATAMTATAVSQCGAIGWIGLVMPHMARMLVGPDHRRLLPTAAVLGGAFLLLIDNLTRTAAAAALPLSIPTAFIGAPFFALLLRRTRQEWAQ
ncbi:iron ABC transporter permease [uncultured Propionibacterium sp.]|uniref:FecCD family ABC transporter permease n=1 Tax=uncultured Propionibacterium sp. TaxID=218066 RepID=UPI00292D7F49|nr:iron ABC transporter permease [uncultured Propionibacterium sp.]